MKDNIFRISVCPRCGQTYTAPPALSRLDNSTLTCPDCGTTEALESTGVDLAEPDQLTDTIHRCQRDSGLER